MCFIDGFHFAIDTLALDVNFYTFFFQCVKCSFLVFWHTACTQHQHQYSVAVCIVADCFCVKVRCDVDKAHFSNWFFYQLFFALRYFSLTVNIVFNHTFKSCKAFCFHLCCRFCRDKTMENCQASAYITFHSGFYGQVQIVDGVCAFLWQWQLCTGDNDGFFKARQSTVKICGCVCHTVCTVCNDKCIVVVFIAPDDFSQLGSVIICHN